MNLIMSMRQAKGKQKFSKATLAAAMRMRLKGASLRRIEEVTGITRSYASKLFNAALNCTGWRYRELPDDLRLEVLRQALAKHEKHVERLKAEIALIKAPQ